MALRVLVLLSALASVACATVNDDQSCQEVTRSTCGTDWSNSCLKCGSSFGYDCEECCPGCTSVTKGSYKYCDCKSPGPGPSPTPTPSTDTWATYEVDGMSVTSVTGGSDASAYSKVVIILHGGGQSGDMWTGYYNQGWFGDLTGMKYVFPTSAISSHVWYNSYKRAGCGFFDDCSYDLDSITTSGSRIASLINHEKGLTPIGGNGKKVFVAGFSEGAQMAGYMQLSGVDFALGGSIVMDGFPLPPMVHWPNHPEWAKGNATYSGDDTKYLIWHGESDTIFPVTETVQTWEGIFSASGITSSQYTVHEEPGMYHTVIEKEMTAMIAWVKSDGASTTTMVEQKA